MKDRTDIPEPSGSPVTLTEPDDTPRGKAPTAPERPLSVDADEKAAPYPSPKGAGANG